jgi:hypothetical protein
MEDICTIMSYSNIKDPEDSQVIWTVFPKKKTTDELGRVTTVFLCHH